MKGPSRDEQRILKWLEELDSKSRTVEGAREWLKRDGSADSKIRMSAGWGWLSTAQIRNLYVAETAGKNRYTVLSAIESASESISEREKQEQSAARTEKARKALRNKANSYSKLSAAELLELAQEMTEAQVKALLEWESGGKNRLSVVRALTGMLSGPGSSTVGRDNAPLRPADSAAVSRAERAVEADNAKVRQARRGTLKVICLSCAHTNSIDYELLQSVLSRQSNSIRGRLERSAARSQESGLRRTGRHGAAAVVKGNELALAQVVSNGFPCSRCGNQLVK